MSQIIKTITSILDSRPATIFFAAWTGVYLVQVIKGEEPDSVDQLWWIVAAFAVAVFII